MSEFLDALIAHMPYPVTDQAARDVRLACAAIAGGGCNLADVAQVTLLLNGTPLPPGHTCQVCGATTGLDTVHVPARLGIAARTEFYCHSRSACYRNRHPLGAVS